jgi:uncharacterized short protein YbdD (DUF466 family)
MDSAASGWRRLHHGLHHRLAALWWGIRWATGDDAYERYLAHWAARHGADLAPPLGRRDFFRAELRRKWEAGPRRCC